MPKTPEPQTKSQFNFNNYSPLLTNSPPSYSPDPSMMKVDQNISVGLDLIPMIYIKNSVPFLQVIWVPPDHEYTVVDNTINTIEFAWEDNASNNIKSELGRENVVILSQKGRLPLCGGDQLIYEIDTRVEGFYDPGSGNVDGYIQQEPFDFLEKMTFGLISRDSFFIGGGWTCDAYSIPVKKEYDPLVELGVLAKEIGEPEQIVHNALKETVYKPVYKGVLTENYYDQCFLLAQSEFYKGLHLGAGLRLIPYRSKIIELPVMQTPKYIVVERQEKVRESEFLHNIMQEDLDNGEIDIIVDIYRKILLEVIEPMGKVQMAIPGLEISLDANTRNFVYRKSHLYLTDLSPPAAVFKGRVFTNYEFLNGPDNNKAWATMFRLLCNPVFQYCYPVAKMFIHGPALQWYIGRPEAKPEEKSFATVSFRRYLEMSEEVVEKVPCLNQIRSTIKMAAQIDCAPQFVSELNNLYGFLVENNFNFSEFGVENLEKIENLLKQYRRVKSLEEVKVLTGKRSAEEREELLSFIVYLALDLITKMRVERGDKPGQLHQSKTIEQSNFVRCL